MASRIPKIPSVRLQNVTVEETFAANNKPHPELIVPTLVQYSRLPAAPGGFPPADGGVTNKHLETQQRSTTAFCPPSITVPQLVGELSPCGSEAEGLSPRTSDAGDSDFSLSASSSCSRSSSTNLSATTSPVLSAVSSFAERPVALTSRQAEGEPRALCRCPATTTTTTTTATTATTTTTTVNTTTTTNTTNTTNTTTSPSAAAPCTRRPAQASMLSPEELLQVLRLINGVYEIYNAQSLRQLKRLSDALKQLEGKKKLEGCAGTSAQAPSLALSPNPLLAPAPTPLASVPEGNEEAAPAPASPRVLPAEEAEAGKELSTATPSEEPAAKPSKGLKHKFGKILRGLFGGCVGRNEEAL
ncbi:hypothetical protein PLESTF_000833700 [Pleodorina starrii]|nr:hypothetical protein PLESTM_000900500 [Pleodorina starrii]GLC69465.1 hypothetical protein PLESTF_000833700 [Pleodorina starrii]